MAISSTPSTPAAVTNRVAHSYIKPATPAEIDFDTSYIPTEYMTSLLFENIGAQELISVTRTDLVNGQNILYTPIKNITDISKAYSPQNIFTIPINAQSQFANSAIKLENYTPEFGTGPNSEMVYLDETTRNLIVNVINMQNNEQVEIEVLNHGTPLGDILY